MSVIRLWHELRTNINIATDSIRTTGANNQTIIYYLYRIKITVSINV